MPYILFDVLPDGSCFYRAVYNVLKAHNNLQKFVKCFLRSVDDYQNEEDLFVKHVRIRMSKLIKERKDHKYIKNVFKTLDDASKEDYLMILDAFPSWIREKYEKKPRSEESFRTFIAKHIKSLSSWASEIDITIFMHFINKCLKTIRIHILNRIPSTRFKPEQNTLYLLNVNEVHYNYLIFTPKPKNDAGKPCKDNQIINAKTNRCIQYDGRTARSLGLYKPRCKSNQILNKLTNRCIKQDGQTAKQLKNQ